MPNGLTSGRRPATADAEQLDSLLNPPELDVSQFTDADLDDSSGRVVHFHFPVEIEVRSTAATIDPEAIITAALDRLVQELRNA
jgi:hypothetical protein